MVVTPAYPPYSFPTEEIETDGFIRFGKRLHMTKWIFANLDPAAVGRDPNETQLFKADRGPLLRKIKQANSRHPRPNQNQIQNNLPDTRYGALCAARY